MISETSESKQAARSINPTDINRGEVGMKEETTSHRWQKMSSGGGVHEKKSPDRKQGIEKVEFAKGKKI